jgi:hypothetical protein
VNDAKRIVGLATLALVLIGCRPTGSASGSGVSSPPTPLEESAVADGPTASPAGAFAPAECYFPEGAALEFAGRSTYVELNVGDAAPYGDVVTDPLADDPADIYITRDTYNQGDLHGRLVCAIFVGDNEGFIEVTVHPEDMARNFTPAPEPGVPAGGLLSREAEEAARAYLPDGGEWDVLPAGSGPIVDFLPDYRDYDWGRDLAADHWVWAVEATRESQAIAMVIDFIDGTVIGTIEFTLDECGRYPEQSDYGEEACPDL